MSIKNETIKGMMSSLDESGDIDKPVKFKITVKDGVLEYSYKADAVIHDHVLNIKREGFYDVTISMPVDKIEELACEYENVSGSYLVNVNNSFMIPFAEEADAKIIYHQIKSLVYGL